jgi:hypothetical protein
MVFPDLVLKRTSVSNKTSASYGFFIKLPSTCLMPLLGRDNWKPGIALRLNINLCQLQTVGTGHGQLINLFPANDKYCCGGLLQR